MYTAETAHHLTVPHPSREGNEGAQPVRKKQISRRRKRQKHTPPAVPLAPPPKPRRRWWSSLLQPRLLVIEIPGAVLVYLGYVALWAQATPVVVAPNASGDASALATPFVVENRGAIFSFSDVTTNCIADQMKWIGPAPFTSVAYGHPQHESGRIAPGESKAVVCLVPISAQLPGQRAQSALDYVRFISKFGIEVSFCRERSFPDTIAGIRRPQMDTNGRFATNYELDSFRATIQVIENKRRPPL